MRPLRFIGGCSDGLCYQRARQKLAGCSGQKRRKSAPSSVLPVPGEPHSSTPDGILALSRAYRCASFRQATTSRSSSFAFSTPATSRKVIAGAAGLPPVFFALL